MISFTSTSPDFNAYLDLIEEVKADSISFPFRSAPYSDFPINEYKQRLARLVSLMACEGVDAVIATQEENVRYFTGYSSVLWISRFRPYFGVLPADLSLGPTLIIPQQEKGNAESSSWIQEPYYFPAQEPPIPYLVKALIGRGLNNGRIGIELGFGQRLGMNQQQFHELVTLLPEVTFIDATPFFQVVRMLKSDLEIDYIDKACSISEKSAQVGWECLRPGMTERELIAIMASKMYELGAEASTKPSFFACMAGERWYLSNAIASDYIIKQGDLIMIDGGANYRGYGCDFIRQASLGQLSYGDKKYFKIIIKADEDAIRVIKPGVHSFEVYEAAMESLSRNGARKYNRQNIVGHGLGLDVHEIPWLGQRDIVFTSDIKLRKGMVLSIEPGIVPMMGNGKPGHLIVEDVVVVTEKGYKILTSHLSTNVWIVK